MPAMQHLNEIYIYLFITILVFWSLKYFAKLIYLFHRKQKITKLQAKGAMLRMSLKKNLRKKANQIDNIVGLEPEVTKKMKEVYKRLFELDYNKHQNYQLLLDGLKEVYDVISNTQYGLNDKIKRIHKESAESAQVSDPENSFKNINFWQRLYETEYHIIMCTYEIINTNSELLKLIKSYNSMVKEADKYDPVPETIEIANFNLFDQVINEKSLPEPVIVAA